MNTFSRRDILQGTLLAGVGTLLWGCQGSSKGSGPMLVPGPVWPDMEPSAAPPAGATPIVGAATPPRAMPVMPQAGGMMTRAAWNSQAPIVSRMQPMNGINRITIHHSAIENTSLRSQGDVARMLNGIRHEHMNRKGEPFGDIGYHYIIDPAGRVWEGRSTSFQGAHVSKNNEHNLGVMLLGNFQSQTPTAAATATLDSFVAYQMQRYNISVNRVYTHQEIGKSACPGRNLQRYMDQTRSRGQLARG
ncbi:MAG TPA: N-acetylmuramoyl-L-alanine amidase, partial [Phycisphaerales bacterium]|nr:N-acetylmuramoyl-L-alanine amidase [Phycisphaerales bacterium]